MRPLLALAAAGWLLGAATAHAQPRPDRAADIDLITASLNTGAGSDALAQEVLDLVDLATEAWPDSARARALRRVEADLTAERLRAFAEGHFAQQPDSVLARAAGWLREPLVARVLAEQRVFDGDSLAAFVEKAGRQGVPPALAPRDSLIRALVERTGYVDYAVDAFTRQMTLVFGLGSAYGGAMEEAVAEFALAQGRAEVAATSLEQGVVYHQFLYRDVAAADVARYLDALDTPGGRALLALRAGSDAERDRRVAALVFDRAGVAPPTWAPDLRAGDAPAAQRERVRRVLLASGFGLLADLSFVDAPRRAMGDLDLTGRQEALLHDAFAYTLRPEVLVDQVVYHLADTADAAELEAHAAWLAQPAVAAFYARSAEASALDAKAWARTKPSRHTDWLVALDTAAGVSELGAAINDRVAWAAFYEIQGRGISLEAVRRFEARRRASAAATAEAIQDQVLFELAQRLHGVPEKEIAPVVKAMYTSEGRAFLRWLYGGLVAASEELVQQAARRYATVEAAQSAARQPEASGSEGG